MVFQLKEVTSPMHPTNAEINRIFLPFINEDCRNQATLNFILFVFVLCPFPLFPHEVPKRSVDSLEME